MRKFLATTLLTTTAVAGMGLAASAAQAAAPKPVARCHNGDVKVTLTPAAHEVGMMKVGWVLKATNVSRHTCSVTGYANLALQNARHQAVHTNEHRGSTWFVQDPGAHKVVLRPGKSAVADLEYAHIRQQGTVHADFLKVQLPGEKGSQTVRLTDPWVFQGSVFVTAFAGHITF